jgi:S-adenosylmethionine synthetase
VDAFTLSSRPAFDESVEIVERKGLGHPDTICDAIAEAVSRALCREYRRRFGRILHHNVDKALLCGGAARPAFRGGEVTEPIRLFLGGRAVASAGGEHVPVGDIAIETARAWFNSNLHAFDAARHVAIVSEIRPGSADLQTLFAGAERGIPHANDTSIGIGYAPLSPLERLVLAAERGIQNRDRAREQPAWGEDVKIMAVRRGRALELTVACAMIGRHLRNRDDYSAAKRALADHVRAAAAQAGFADCTIGVNAADTPDAIYLTVTGTSAEAGDDGEVGRGNRVNGLITPGRPMSLEAAAGKNPVSHVGKIYNVVAQRICEALIAAAPEIAAAECRLVSRIGAPITEPALIELRLTARDGAPLATSAAQARAIAAEQLRQAPVLADAFVDGRIAVF